MIGKKVQKRWALAGVILSFALVAAACGGSSEESSGESGGALSEGQTYKVGYAASQTGRLAIFEQPFIEGLQLAVDELNAAGGIDGKVPIELTIKDARSDPSAGGVVAQELIDDGAQFLITACDADASLPASQLAQQRGIPVISSCGSGSSLPAQVGDFQFMNVFGTEIEGVAMAEFAADQGYQTAYIMTSTDIEYTDSMMKAATAELENQGVDLLGTENFRLDQPSYTAQATTIASASPDVVITSMFLPASVTFLRNLRAAGYDGPVIGPDGQEGSETFSAAEAARDLFVFSFGYPSDDASGQALIAFNEAFAAKYGDAPGTVIAALGGDVVCLIDYSVTTADTTDPEAVRDALSAAVDVPCPTGPISYEGRNGIPKKDVVVLEADVDAGEFKFVKRFFPGD